MALNQLTSQTRLPIEWIQELDGYLGPDIYSTAWVAMVPDLDDPSRPAWPQAMDFIRANQLAQDGGWGEPIAYYAHERTISTLAAILALHTWSADSALHSIRKAIRTLHTYAQDLATEPYAPVGFELLLPSLVEALSDYRAELPLERWEKIVLPQHEKKLRLIQGLSIDLYRPQAWWFSLELLPPERLAAIDEQVLSSNGSIQTSVAATAAYLRAKRLQGQDAPQVALYLDALVNATGGGVPFSFPAENFERVWGIDNFRRVGMHPDDPIIAPVIASINQAWHQGTLGLSSSKFFDVNDGDDTLLGFAILQWAGLAVDDAPVLNFWSQDHFRSYLDESDASISANIHGLEALRLQHDQPNRDHAETLTRWLQAQMGQHVPFYDKWHLSPLYSAAHALHATLGWDATIAFRCLDFILENQREDGGWGWFGQSTQEETAHCIIALGHAAKHGCAGVDAVLSKATRYLADVGQTPPTERLWVGKTLFRPEGVIKTLLQCAQIMVVQLGYFDELC